MRQLFAAFIMASAVFLGAGTASAQTATQDINLTATVDKYCQFVAPATGADINEVIPVDASGVVDTTVISNTISTVACNFAATMTASSLSGGVVSATAATADFTNIINYTGTATLDGSLSSAINTATTATAAGSEADASPGVSAGPLAGDLVITIAPATPALPLVAATDYADTFRVTLVPN